MKQDFVTLPREVVEQALKAMEDAGVQRGSTGAEFNAIESLRAAMDQPQNHVPDAGNMLQAGWKLVPLEPNCSMVLAGERSLEQHDFLRLDYAYRAMLDAAPNPPTVKESSTVEQPQSNQPAMTPIAQRKLDDLVAGGYTISGYSVYHEQKHQHGFVTGAGLVGWWKPEGVEHPQQQADQEPVAWLSEVYEGGHVNLEVVWRGDFGAFPVFRRQQPWHPPLTDEQKAAVTRELNRARCLEKQIVGNVELTDRIARAIESAHNIK